MRTRRTIPYKELASRALDSFSPPLFENFRIADWHDKHPQVEYSINSHGFRGAEFSNPDTVVLGCSVTYGIGLPVEMTWPYLLGEKIGAFNNISIPGGSVPQIVDVAMAVMNDFSHPKHIFFLIPNIDRIHAAFDVNGSPWWTYAWSSDIDSFISMNLPKVEPFFLKTHNGRRVSIPVEMAISESFKAIIRMSNFARTIGSRFSCFSWSDRVNSILAESGIEGFIDGGHVQPKGQCHEGLSSSEFWDCAIDRGTHPGLHHHTHYKERFERVLI